MNLQDFKEKIAYVTDQEICGELSKVWLSKVDDSFITIEGMDDDFKRLLKYGIIEEVQSNNGRVSSIGFNPTEQKWYGWSHRAIYGFGVGSTCEKGNIHYHPVEEDFLEDCVRFWTDENALNLRGEEASENGVKGVRVFWTRSNNIPNKKLRGEITSIFTAYPDSWGRGEWIAQTLEDAKIMAQDFSSGCS